MEASKTQEKRPEFTVMLQAGRHTAAFEMA